MSWHEVYKKGLWNNVDEYPELDEIISLCKSKDERIIDIGCSYGRLSMPLAKLGFYVVGVDIAEEPIRVLGQKREGMRNLSVCCCEATKLPFNANLFNGCISINAIYHSVYEDICRSIKEIERVLVPGGWFYGTFLSKEDWKYGVGECLGKDTFLSIDGADPGVPHWFAAYQDIEEIFSRWQCIQIRHDKSITSLGVSAHWTVTGILDKSN